MIVLFFSFFVERKRFIYRELNLKLMFMTNNLIVNVVTVCKAVLRLAKKKNVLRPPNKSRIVLLKRKIHDDTFTDHYYNEQLTRISK